MKKKYLKEEGNFAIALWQERDLSRSKFCEGDETHSYLLTRSKVKQSVEGLVWLKLSKSVRDLLILLRVE